MADEQKQQKRALMMAERAELGEDERQMAANAVVPLVKTGAALSVGLYYPVRGEFDCIPLLDALASRGLKTALPVVARRHDKLVFRPWKPSQALQTGEYGIPVPLDKGLSIVPELLIVPLLGFDANGGRLGYGGGYYDRTLQFLRQCNQDFKAMGIAYDFQQMDEVPVEPHDQHLDAIVTPSGVITIGAF